MRAILIRRVTPSHRANLIHSRDATLVCEAEVDLVAKLAWEAVEEGSHRVQRSRLGASARRNPYKYTASGERSARLQRLKRLATRLSSKVGPSARGTVHYTLARQAGSWHEIEVDVLVLTRAILSRTRCIQTPSSPPIDSKPF